MKKRVVIPQNPFTPSALAQDGPGFIPSNAPRAQLVEQDARRLQRPGRTGVDSIDQALLASRHVIKDNEESRRNMRDRRMHLWNNQRATLRSVAMRQNRARETTKEDVSMGGVK